MAKCKYCEGTGKVDFPNISGHDYTTKCEKCSGTGKSKKKKYKDKQCK